MPPRKKKTPTQPSPDDIMAWKDDDWLPVSDRVSDHDLQSLWDTAPDLGILTKTRVGDHTYVVMERDSWGTHERIQALNDVIQRLTMGTESLKQKNQENEATIQDLKEQLKEARKPDETEALAALWADTSKVRMQMRNRIAELEASLAVQISKTNEIQRKLNNAAYQSNRLLVHARQLSDLITVADEQPVASQQLTGVLGDAQRSIEDSLGGSSPTPTSSMAATTSKFGDLEID